MGKTLSFILGIIASLQDWTSRAIKQLFVWLLKPVEKPAVRLVAYLTDRFGWETNVVENAFVLIVLVARLLIMGEALHPWSWVELFAAFRVAQTALIAQRLDERQTAALKLLSPNIGEAIRVHCAHLLERYFFDKEAAWMTIFIHKGMWSALIVTLVMMELYPWRDAWRRYHPLKLNLQGGVG